jgi:hypothetical protein
MKAVNQDQAIRSARMQTPFGTRTASVRENKLKTEKVRSLAKMRVKKAGPEWPHVIHAK